MFEYFILKDKRLEGSLPYVAGMLISSDLDASTTLQTAFTRINMAAKAYGKLKTLFIICHGYGTGIAQWADDFWWKGGTGLQLGKEEVNAGNVASWAAIKNSVDFIVVYACGAAYTGQSSPFSPQAKNDGQGLMKQLSAHTNAIVFAADKIQWYYPDDLNFGKWEGNVYMFFPTGAVVPGFAPPVDVIDVTSPLPEPGPGITGYYQKIFNEIERSRRQQ